MATPGEPAEVDLPRLSHLLQELRARLLQDDLAALATCEELHAALAVVAGTTRARSLRDQVQRFDGATAEATLDHLARVHPEL